MPDAPSRSQRFGLYTGIVASVDDPEQRGRVQLRIPALFGQEVHPAWALPIGMHVGDGSGTMIVPDVGTAVFVMFVDGSPEIPAYLPGAWPEPGPSVIRSDPQFRPLQNAYPRVRLLWHSTVGRGLSLTELDNGDTTLHTERTILRVENEGGRVELDLRPGEDGKLVVNDAGDEQRVARTNDTVDVGSLDFTFTPGSAASLSVTYNPPNGRGAPVVLASGSGSIPLLGVISSGSPSVLIGD